MADDPEDPPIFRTWKQFYLFVVMWLLVLIIVFYLFTQYFS
jgi:hypothetical protein